MVYDFQHDSMLATYIDFPGHVEELDDGTDAASYPLEKLWRVEATVAHFDRPSGSGPIDVDDFKNACPEGIRGGAIVVNALGERRYDQIAERSVYITRQAAEWIVDSGVHLIYSDVYEFNEEPQGVFPIFFAGGVSTVCQPINLHALPTYGCRVTALPLRFNEVTQLPCRALAEVP
jgi:kynurenine formamidase